MFTGIVQTQGKLLTLTSNDFGARLAVARGKLTTPVAHGDSICVSGVCLTAVEITDDTLSFDVIAETLAKTKLGDLAEGDSVNLEPAVTPASRWADTSCRAMSMASGKWCASSTRPTSGGPPFGRRLS